MKNLRIGLFLGLAILLVNCKINKNSQQNSTQNILAINPIIIDTTIIIKKTDSIKVVKVEKPSKINLLFQKPEIITELPVYDINNLPISFWLLKDNDKNVGFIVAGHAYKEVCELASYEVLSEIERIGKIDTTIFTYGVGFDVRANNSDLWNLKYDSLLNTMNKKFKELSNNNPEQVIVNEINYKKYFDTQELIKKHISNANQQMSYDTHIVEYKYDNSPLIVPFYDVKTVKPIVFNIPKDAFGVIPSEATNNQILVVLEKLIKEITLMNKSNKEQLAKLTKKGINDKSDFFDKFGFNFSLIKFGKQKGIESENLYLESYEKGPGGTVTTTGFINGVKTVTSRDVTFEETKNLLSDGETKFSSQDRKELNEYIRKEPIFQKKFNDNKKSLMNKYQSTISNNTVLISELIKQKKQIQNNTKDNYIYLDAFLRGWPFSMESDEANKKLDKWFDEYRPKVWAKILEKIPNSQKDDKIAGVFHSDDVFFQVKLVGSNFMITPYKVVGGNFLQVIDKNSGICTFYTVFNFRDKL